MIPARLRVSALVVALGASLLPAAAPVWAQVRAADGPPVIVQPYSPLPVSLEALPLGGPTALPWRNGRTLHVAGTTIRTDLRRIASRGGTTVVGKGTGLGQSRTEWRLVVGDRLKRLPTRGSTAQPLVSADGRWLAWLDVHRPPYTGADETVRFRLVVYDARARRVVAVHRETRTSEPEDESNGLGLLGLDNAGRVLVARGEAGLAVFGVGRQMTSLKAPHTLYGDDWDGWPGGVSLLRYGGSAVIEAVYGTVSRRGRFREIGRMPFDVGQWSPGGDHFLVESGDEHGHPAFYAFRTADRVALQLGLPSIDESAYLLGWESPTQVVVRFEDRYGDDRFSLLVRCAVTDGACERVAEAH